jgi:hypothetical protein
MAKRGLPPVLVSRHLGKPYSAVLLELLVSGVDMSERAPIGPGLQWIRSKDSFEAAPKEVAERHKLNLVTVLAEFYKAGQDPDWSPVPVNYQHPFWENVEVRAPGECWAWTGPKFLEYGMPTSVQESRAHRYSFRRHYNSPVFDVRVLHHCDNPECTNPDHLFLGTPKDNMDDMSRKDRSQDGGGVRAFTPAQVIEFRRRYFREDVGIFELLEDAPVSAHQTVADMLCGDTYSEFPVWPPYSDTVPDPEIVDQLLHEYRKDDPELFDQRPMTEDN